jgi:hypothetical protein
LLQENATASIRAHHAWKAFAHWPAAADHPFLALQKTFSDGIVVGLDTWRDLIETIAEQTFLVVYGSLQAAVGIDPADTRPQRKTGKDPLHRQLVEARGTSPADRVPHPSRLSVIDGCCRRIWMSERAGSFKQCSLNANSAGAQSRPSRSIASISGLGVFS